MRNKTVWCARCNRKILVVANLDSGRVIHWSNPENCVSRAACLDEFARGVFDRQFGASIISPQRF